jgi:hypothetical protein
MTDDDITSRRVPRRRGPMPPRGEKRGAVKSPRYAPATASATPAQAAPPPRIYTAPPNMNLEQARELLGHAAADPCSVLEADADRARAMVKAAWAQRHGFSELPGHGWRNLISGALPPSLPPSVAEDKGSLPGSHGPGELFAFQGGPFVWIAQPLLSKFADDDWDRMRAADHNLGLQYRIISGESGWRAPGKTLFIARCRRGDWRRGLWQPWAELPPILAPWESREFAA